MSPEACFVSGMACQDPQTSSMLQTYLLWVRIPIRQKGCLAGIREAQSIAHSACSLKVCCHQETPFFFLNFLFIRPLHAVYEI